MSQQESQSITQGSLFLIPAPLFDVVKQHGDEPILLPVETLAKVQQLRHFVVENAKTARAILKHYQMPCPISELHLRELNQHTKDSEIQGLLEPLFAGHDLGLLSDAGCPAVADPGAKLVALAQARRVQVCPWVGPSSLLLGLMASGLDGQRFAFHGYLPIDDAARREAIKSLEIQSKKTSQTQICIETPFRNRVLFQTLLAVCDECTRVCVAIALTTPQQLVMTKTVKDWRKSDLPPFDKVPTVFLWLA